MVLFIGAESGSVLVFVEVKLLVGFGFCKSLKVGILYRTYEKVSRPGPCNVNGDPLGPYPYQWAAWILLGDPGFLLVLQIFVGSLLGISPMNLEIMTHADKMIACSLCRNDTRKLTSIP